MTPNQIELAKIRLGLDQGSMSCDRIDSMVEEVKKIVEGGPECLFWYLHVAYLAASMLGYRVTALELDMAGDMAVKESGNKEGAEA